MTQLVHDVQRTSLVTKSDIPSRKYIPGQKN